MDQFQISYIVFLITSKYTKYDLKKYEKVSISNYSEKKNILLTHMDINFFWELHIDFVSKCFR